MILERRKYTRYRVQADTYAAFGSQFTKVGKARDISIAGLAFEYINGMADIEQRPVTVSIFLTGAEFFLWNVPCRLIYDIRLKDFDVIPEDSKLYVYRKCGLLFETDRADQKKNLESFIVNHTRGIAASSGRQNRRSEFG